MALSRAKAAFLLCNVLAVATLLIIYQSECLNTKPKVKDLVNTPEPTTRGISITPTSKITTVLSTTKQTVISNTYTLKTTGTLNASKPKVTSVAIILKPTTELFRINRRKSLQVYCVPKPISMSTDKCITNAFKGHGDGVVIQIMGRALRP